MESGEGIAHFCAPATSLYKLSTESGVLPNFTAYLSPGQIKVRKGMGLFRLGRGELFMEVNFDILTPDGFKSPLHTHPWPGAR